MTFFGLVWVTAWIGSFLSLYQSLPPSLRLYTTKVSQPRPFFVQSKQPALFWSATLLPTRFLKIDWGDKKSRPTLIQAPNSLAIRLKNSKNQFCPFLQQTTVEKAAVKTITNLSTATLVELSSTHPSFLANKILRSLQSFFRFSNHFEQSFGFASLPVAVVSRNEDNYEVWLNQRLIANLPNKLQANLMQQRLTGLLKTSNLNASQLRPTLIDGVPALMAGNRFLFGVDKKVAEKANRNGELLAIEWTNNLRSALKAPPLSLVEGQLELYGLKPSQKKMYGLASWYGSYFHGRLTANGEIFNQNELTVAHKSLPFNTFLKVTNLQTKKAVIVRVNDRGPYIPPRSLDLSRVAARCINSEIAGVVPYEAVIMQPSEPKLLTLRNHKPAKKLAVITDF